MTGRTLGTTTFTSGISTRALVHSRAERSKKGYKPVIDADKAAAVAEAPMAASLPTLIAQAEELATEVELAAVAAQEAVERAAGSCAHVLRPCRRGSCRATKFQSG